MVLLTLLYYMTVFFPLRVRDLYVSFLTRSVKSHRVLENALRIFGKVSLMGLLPDGNILVYPLDDLKLLPIISEIYDRRIYDVDETRDLKKVCDVGAHIGIFTLRISRLAPNSNFIAIEPNPVNASFLSSNVLLNGLGRRVRILNMGVGKKVERKTLWLSRLSGGDGSTKRWHDAGTAGQIAINLTSLDKILLYDESYDMVKIDVEGGEYEVLMGLEKCYRKVKRLVLEVHTSIVNLADMLEWLSNHRFAIIRKQKLYEDCVILETGKIE